MQQSNNAYMLVYTSRRALNEIRVKSDEEIVIIETSSSGSRISGKSSTTPSKNGQKTAKNATATPKNATAIPPAKAAVTEAFPDRKRKPESNAVKLEDGPLPIYLKAFIQEDRRLLEDELQEHILMKQTKHKEQV